MMNMSSVEGKKKLLGSDQVIQQSFGGPGNEGWITHLRESKDSLFTHEFLPNPPPFFFKERMSKLDWKEVSKVDPNKIKANVDLPKMSSMLNNLVFGYVDSEEIERFGERMATKTIHMLQYCVEYLLYVQDYVTKSCELLDSKYKELDEDYTIVYEIAKKRKKQIDLLKSDIKNKNKVIEMYELMIQKSNDEEALAYSCIHCPEKFLSLHLLKQHHSQFHRKKDFDESLYTKNIHHKNAKERKELEQRMLEEQQRREKIKEKELKALQDDLKSLRRDLSHVMKSEISGIVKDKDDNLKMIDKKLVEMKSMVTSTLAHKDDHKKWVEDHEDMQETKLSDLKTHIDTTLVKYKEDLDQKLKTINREKDKVREDLQAEISGKDNELSIYKKKIDQLKRDLNKAHENLESKDKEAKDANSVLSKTQTERDNSARTKKVIEDRLAVLEKHNDGLTTENGKLKKEVKDLEKDLTELNKQLESTGGQKDSMIASLNRELKEKDDNYALQTNELNKLKAEKNKLDDEKEDLIREKNKLTKDIEAKKFLADKDTKKEIRDLTIQVKDLEKQLKESDQKRKELEDEIRKLRENHKQHIEEVKKLEKSKKKYEASKPEEQKKPEPKPKQKTWKHTKLSIILREYRNLSENRDNKPPGMGEIIKDKEEVLSHSSSLEPHSLSLAALYKLMVDKNQYHEMLDHKYRDPMKTKFQHTLTEFEKLRKKVAKKSVKYEGGLVKKYLKTKDNILTEELSEPQLDRLNDLFVSKNRDVKNDLNSLDGEIQKKEDNLRPNKDAEKRREKILKKETILENERAKKEALKKSKEKSKEKNKEKTISKEENKEPESSRKNKNKKKDKIIV